MSDLMALPFVFPATPTVPPAQVATGLAFAARCCSDQWLCRSGLKDVKGRSLTDARVVVCAGVTFPQEGHGCGGGEARQMQVQLMPQRSREWTSSS